MPTLFIDNRPVEVSPGRTILEAAEKLGIHIPTMCYRHGYEPCTSCMVCLVEVEGSENLIPACGAIAQENMRIRTDTERVRAARRTALELLLSDHLGDCIAPCQLACPAHMNIPLMIRHIAAGRLDQAIAVIKRDIPLPAVLGRICPAPCEKACRRRFFDQPLAICLLKRFAAETDLLAAEPYTPARSTPRPQRIAIVGAGPAGLAAAYYLQIKGYNCTVFDDHEHLGGMLRYAVPESRLPRNILEKEIARILELGPTVQPRTRIGQSLSLQSLRENFHAVFLALGRISPQHVESLGLKAQPNGIAVDPHTYQTSLPGVFAGGDAVRNRRLTVRAVADGKEAAIAIDQYLSGKDLTGPTRPFNTRIGRLKDGEIHQFLATANRTGRISPASPDASLTADQARLEAQRCLHCDCRKAQTCKLRAYAQQYNAKPATYKADRPLFVQLHQHPHVIYEPGKCIKCGLCIQIAARAGEKIGLAFIGRGFDVRIAPPFNRPLSDALQHVAAECVHACPTGALAFKDTAQPTT